MQPLASMIPLCVCALTMFGAAAGTMDESVRRNVVLALSVMPAE